MMNRKLKEKRAVSWMKYVLLGAVLVLIVSTVLLLPRTNWSLKKEGRMGFPAQDTPGTAPSAKEIRHVVLISIDTCRADHLSCYGYSRRTSPNIDAVAAEGVLFNHVVTPVPITLPAHSSMLTGTVPPYHGVGDNNHFRLSSSNVTLAEILRENGFVTGAVVGSYILRSHFGIAQGFDSYNDAFEINENRPFFSGNERSAERVSYWGNTWLEQHRDEKFFLFLHYYDPHDPYELHKDFVFSSLPFVNLSKDRYDGEIAYVDHYIGQVIRKLKELNLYDSTLLIITADHGESLGQHSEDTHGFFTYHSSIHVPLVMRVPGGPKGAVINDLAGIIDIVPTVCGSLGIDVPEHVHGKDLNSFFSNKGGSVEGRYLYCESLIPTKFDLGPLFGLVSDRWKYVHSLRSELYDLRKDPYETKNLFTEQTQQAGIMREQLRLIFEDYRISDIVDNKMAVDEETRRRLQSLGYVASRSVDASVQFGQLGEKRLDPKDFIEVYNSFEKIFPLVERKKFSEAKRVCYNLLKKWPGMEQAYFFLGNIALLENDTQAMVKYFSRFLAYTETDSNDSDLRLEFEYECAIAHINLGVAFAHEGKPEKAIEHYTKALFYDPYSVKANYNLADAYMMLGKLGDSVKYYTRTLELAPDFAEAHYNLGNVLLKQERFEMAAIHYRMAVKLRPDWHEARHNLKLVESRKKQ
jgi:arylsulfatase A-like enzyme